MEDTKKGINSVNNWAPESEYIFQQNPENTKKELLERLNDTPFSIHGKLRLNGPNIVDKNGETFQLKWVCPIMYDIYSWFANKDIIKSLRDNRGCNVIRLALYTEVPETVKEKVKWETWLTLNTHWYCGGNTDEKERLTKSIKDCVETCKELWMYVIIDRHILHEKTPQTHEEEAKEFFWYISKTFKDCDNIIYEICNEPGWYKDGDGKYREVSWEEIKEYADTIISIIKNNNKDAIIVVGTPHRSQDIVIKPEDRINKRNNIMYAFHFYAASHQKLKDKLSNAINMKVPVFVSEFSICEYDWAWKIDMEEAKKWFKILDDSKISYVARNLSDYNQASSLLKPSTKFDELKVNSWEDSQYTISLSEDDLSETWKIILNHIKCDKK